MIADIVYKRRKNASIVVVFSMPPASQHSASADHGHYPPVHSLSELMPSCDHRLHLQQSGILAPHSVRESDVSFPDELLHNTRYAASQYHRKSARASSPPGACDPSPYVYPLPGSQLAYDHRAAHDA